MKVLDSMWFNTRQGSFGFVLGENEIGKRMLYAGVASGLDQKADEQEILSWGNKVNIGMMESLIAKTKKS
jgi:ATPase subunit of ABC transporter with duplicated ATPase domains